MPDQIRDFSEEISILDKEEVKSESTDSLGLDEFERFRLSQDFKHLGGAKKLLTTVPVRKPNKQQFVRTRMKEGFVIDVMLLEYGESRETYLIEPGIDDFMQATPTRLILAVDRLENWFIWPVKLPKDELSQSGWHRSAIEAAEHAKSNWVRIQANMSLGAYEIYQAEGDLPDPNWPDESFSELLRIAFKGHIIDSQDHIILRQLLGQV